MKNIGFKLTDCHGGKGIICKIPAPTIHDHYRALSIAQNQPVYGRPIH